MPDILFFSEVNDEDFPIIGEKAKKLSMLSKSGFRIPPGFIVTCNVMQKLLSRRDIQNKIADIYKSSPEALKEKSANLKKSILGIEFPDGIADELIDAYLSLSVSLDKPTTASLLASEEAFVALRNSCQASLHSPKTILNIKGKDSLFKSILESYADNFSPEQVAKTRQEDLSCAIIVQRMIDSEKSGSAFTNNSDIIITACFGFGVGLESGLVFPDTYVLDKNTNSMKGIKVGEKNFAFVRDIDTDATIKQELGEKSRQQVLDDREISDIVSILKRATAFFGKEQKIEWAIKKGTAYIIQSKDNSSGQPEQVQFSVTDATEEPLVEPEKIDLQPDEEDFIFPPDSEIDKAAQLSDDIEIIHLDILGKPKPVNPAVDIKPEEIIIKSDDKEDKAIEDDSIFSSYKGDDKLREKSDSTLTEDNHLDPRVDLDNEMHPDQPTHHGVSRISELARMNAGNAVVYCHLAVKENLKQRLLRYVNETPDDFTAILDKLVEYENLDDELNYRKVDKAARDFMVKLRYPEPAEVEIALRMIR